MRITTGKIKGKEIKLSKKLRNVVRPTKSLIRNSMFEVIGSRINGSKCLDLFCGTGVIGLEAYSRGARKVTLVDKRNILIKKIKKFLRKNNIVGIRCEAIDYVKFIRNSSEKYNILFLDPPYNLFHKQDKLVSLCSCLLKSNGIIYLENYKSNLKEDINFRGFKNIKIGTNGRIIYFLLIKI
ncbi:RsmD family RNA methyltransferase [Candidatus Vidania fulgoroideae]|uniref:RsmD family RNA methyltransferase n=1 Tax=Candidatus Vidania fulgoroideorum TaxID=881286 RepID=A0A974X9U7_9PROT|nr:RsmD family RNA methyltransferase [Candidatus Vidania fulgoroideae]